MNLVRLRRQLIKLQQHAPEATAGGVQVVVGMKGALTAIHSLRATAGQPPGPSRDISQGGGLARLLEAIGEPVEPPAPAALQSEPNG